MSGLWTNASARSCRERLLEQLSPKRPEQQRTKGSERSNDIGTKYRGFLRLRCHRCKSILASELRAPFRGNIFRCRWAWRLEAVAWHCSQGLRNEIRSHRVEVLRV